MYGWYRNVMPPGSYAVNPLCCTPDGIGRQPSDIVRHPLQRREFN